MISEKIQKAFNKQINEEIQSAYLYMSMAAYFESINLNGFATWMQTQAKEENKHAMKFWGHITERMGKVTLTQIASPKTEWSSPLNAFEEAYKHETHITKCINDLVTLAREENDNAASVFLNYFVNEQVEEESSADSVVQKLRMIKDAPQGLLMLDSILGQRKE